METHLTYDNKGEALGILVKQRLTTRNNLQIKVQPTSAPRKVYFLKHAVALESLLHCPSSSCPMLMCRVMLMQVVGVLNTVSGQLEYCARVRKMFGVPKPRPRAAAALPADFLRTVRRSMQVGG